MRNLKKVLSLALCLVMLLGMMVVGAGAAEYKDSSEIAENKTEAVDVMSALKILEGSNGSFNPKGNLTREQAAKIMVFVADGPVVANALGKTETKFDDVAATRWSSGFVAYCSDLGIIAGSNGKFRPGDNVTAQEFAKMLLVAMGGNEDSYTGSGWATNVQRDAIKAELNENADVTLWSKEITREQASQMAFNAMTGNLEGPKTVYPVIKKIDSSVVATFDTALEAAMYANALGSTNYEAGTPVRDTAGTLGEKNYGLEQDTTTVDAFGRPTKTWTANNDVKVVIDTNTAVATYAVDMHTAAADKKTVNDDLKGYTYADALKPTCYGLSNATTIDSADDVAALTDNGVIVEVYASGKNITNVVVIKKTVAKLNADPVVKNDKVTISAAGIVNAETKNVKGYDTVSKGDVVLYVSNGKGAFTIEPADKITAAVTGYTSGGYATGKALIDGERYAKTALTGSGMNYSAAITDTKTYDIWLDNGRNIVATAAAGTGETQTAQLAVVQEVAYVQPSTDHAIGSSSNPYIQARLVFMDGTSEVVKVGSVDGYTLVDKTAKLDTIKKDNVAATHYIKATTKAGLDTAMAATTPTLTAVGTDTLGVSGGPFIAVYKDDDGTYDATNTKLYGKYYGVTTNNNATALTDLVGDGKLLTLKTFYSYTEKDGTYTLTTPKADVGANTALQTDAKITNGQAKFNGTSGLIGNANTVFIYASKDSNNVYSFQAYTGIANVPTTKENTTATDTALAKGGVASYVYVDLGTNGTATASSDKVFITNDDFVTVNGSTAYKQGKVLLNGEETELKLKDVAYTVGVLYSVAGIDGNEIYELTAETPKTGIKSVAGNVLTVNAAGTGEVFTYADDAVAYVLDGNTVETTTISALILDANDKITVVTDTDGAAVAAYVQKVTQAPTVVTVATATDSTNSVTVPTDGTQAMAISKSTTVTNWTAAHCKVNLTLDATTGTKIDSVAVNGTKLTAGLTGEGTPNDLTAAADVVLVEGDNSITITVKDDNGGPDEIFTYTVKAVKA